MISASKTRTAHSRDRQTAQKPFPSIIL